MRTRLTHARQHWSEFWTDRHRWIFFFITSFLFYGYMFTSAIQGEKSDANPEQREATMLWTKRGYHEKRDDPSTPSLFRWDTWEILVVFFLLGSFVACAYFVYQWSGMDQGCVYAMQVILLWIYLALIILAIPGNKFHRRFYYNTRSYMVRVLNRPGRELLVAFVFLVMFPLPGQGHKPIRRRFEFLLLKLGIFYLVQAIVLGPPRYSIEPPEQEKVIPLSSSELTYYLIVVVLMGIIWKLQDFTAP